MVGQWVKKCQHLKKNYFTKIRTKTIVGYGKKVDFLIPSRVEFWTVS